MKKCMIVSFVLSFVALLAGITLIQPIFAHQNDDIWCHQHTGNGCNEDLRDSCNSGNGWQIGRCTSPTATPTVTPTQIVTPTQVVTPTEEVTPTQEVTPTEEITPTPEPTQDPGNQGGIGGPGPGDGLSDGRSDGLSSCPECTAPPKIGGGQVLGASTDFAGTGTTNDIVMNVVGLLGGLSTASGFVLSAKKKLHI